MTIRAIQLLRNDHHRSMTPSRRAGFTVIEMLVTLAIIIVLVGVLIVALSQASGTAQPGADSLSHELHGGRARAVQGRSWIRPAGAW